MNPDFRNMVCDHDTYQHSVLETLELYRIDLSQYVLRLDSKYVDMLTDPSPGLYMNGAIHPFIYFGPGMGYYSHTAVSNRDTVPDIVKFDDVWKHRGSIYDHEGRPVFCIIPGTQHHYSEYPIWHPAAIYIAYIYILESFRYLNPLSSPYSNVEKQLTDLRTHVKPQFLPNFDGSYEDYLQSRGMHHFYDEDNEDLILLGAKLREFIGQNRYNVYRFYLSNTTMTIEKGNDFRVIEYYRMITSHMSEI